MSEAYFVGLLLSGGMCLAFAVHAMTLAVSAKERAFFRLALFALLGCAYCVVAYGYFRELDSKRALAWGRGICIFTPFITWLFTELVSDLTGVRPRWLRILQHATLGLSLGFSAAVLADAALGTKIALTGVVETDLSAPHRHRLFFTPLGTAWLGFVSLTFVVCSVVLVRGWRAKRHLLPMVVGSIVYFVTTVSDFNILNGFYEFYFVQHLGYVALIGACWRVLSQRYEKSLDELESIVATLQEQHRELLTSAPIAQQHKLDAIGTLAAGVAHEINNPIQTILNYAQLLKKRVTEEEPQTFAGEIEIECRRAAEIVQALLRFARAEDGQLGTVSIDELVHEVVKLTQSTLEADSIRLEVDLPNGLPRLEARAQHLRQVLMNLLTNARDALCERDSDRRDPRTVRISAHTVERAGAAWLVIETADNADGIEPGLLDRIFDPFFTTKGVGKGTGLGLSISQGIVSSHGGRLTCETKRGEGTCFRIELPVVRAPCPAERRSSSSTRVSRAF